MAFLLILKSWTDAVGRVRRYVNNVPELIGLDVDRYNTGNIRHAELNGIVISNAAAKRILGAKVWLDDTDTVHVDHWNEPYAITADRVRELVRDAYTAQSSGAQA